MRKFKLILSAAAITVMMSFTAFAGSWKNDGTGWQYKNDDGSCTANSWQWIDGDNNGTAECYYFNQQGYCLVNTTTPDGCSVDDNGAWIVDGIVQTQRVAAQASQETTASKEDTAPKSSVVWLSKTGKKYHRNPNCGNMKNPIEATLEEALSQGRTPCSKCN